MSKIILVSQLSRALGYQHVQVQFISTPNVKSNFAFSAKVHFLLTFYHTVCLGVLQ